MKNPKNILITGASSGIGRALALYYASKGVRLYLTGRDKSRLDEVVRLCGDSGAIVEGENIDVADQEKMASWILGFKNLDLVIANAGISGGTGGRQDGEPLEEARTIFNVNICLLYTSPSPRDRQKSRMPSSA